MSVHVPENLVLGATFTTLSCLGTAVMSALVKATETLTSAADILLFQNLIGFLLVLPFALRGGWRSLKTEKAGLHVVRAASGTAAWYALFIAITMMPMTNATLLTCSAPLWMPVIAWVFLREKASKVTWIGATVGFVGVTMVLRPQHQEFNLGALIPLAGAVCLAVAWISLRRLGATEPTSRILFYYFGISTVLCLPVAVLDWRPFGLRGSVYLVGIAAILLVSQVLIVLAYRYAPPVKAGPFIYTVVVFTALIDWFLWNEVPTLVEVFGMVLVIGAGIIAIRKTSQAPAGEPTESVKDHLRTVKKALRPVSPV